MGFARFIGQRTVPIMPEAISMAIALSSGHHRL